MPKQDFKKLLIPFCRTRIAFESSMWRHSWTCKVYFFLSWIWCAFAAFSYQDYCHLAEYFGAILSSFLKKMASPTQLNATMIWSCWIFGWKLFNYVNLEASNFLTIYCKAIDFLVTVRKVYDPFWIPSDIWPICSKLSDLYNWLFSPQRHLLLVLLQNFAKLSEFLCHSIERSMRDNIRITEEIVF